MNRRRRLMAHQNRNKIRGCLWLMTLCAAFMMVLAFASPRAAFAQQADAIVSNLDGGKINIKVNSTTVVKTVRPYKRVSVGQPDVADFNAIAPTSILLTAKKPGTTQLIIWDDQERSQIMDVIVAMDLDALKDQYKLAFPNAKIDVGYSNGTVILRGQVADLDAADHAVQ